MTHQSQQPSQQPLQASMDLPNQAALQQLMQLQMEQTDAIREIKDRVGCLYYWLILSIIAGVLLGGCGAVAYVANFSR